MASIALHMGCVLQLLLVNTAAVTSRVGGAAYSPLVGSVKSAMSLDSAKKLLEDAWVDTHISTKTPPCKSLKECGWNISVAAYADIAGSKRFLLSGTSQKDAQQCGNVSSSQRVDVAHAIVRTVGSQRASEVETGAEAAEAKFESAKVAQRLALEAHAVRLSVLLDQSCTVSGHRACWRGSGAGSKTQGSAGPRQLRPITVSFGETKGARAAREMPQPVESSLRTSLRDFRFPA